MSQATVTVSGWERALMAAEKVKERLQRATRALDSAGVRYAVAEWVGRIDEDAVRTTRDVDLLIRTGGEQRLSDFLLWECAYAELIFTARMCPDFDASDLAAAVAEFHSRDRRFGAVPVAAQA